MASLAETGRPSFGLYVHWPFCAAKCPYCDFNSHVATRIDEDAWRDALVSEVQRMAQETGPRVLDTVYFGGGTPSLMAPGTVEAVLAAARTGWHCANDPEVTLEANPGSVEAARFHAYRDAGVNRVSLGVQALNDADLRRLGRIHTADQGRRALEIARESFERVSFDLIYARQDQSVGAWEAELAEALSWNPDHLSLYQLTIEDGTVFAARNAAGHLRGLPDEDRSADLYEMTQEMTRSAGLPAYETSNHARPGAESRHNMIYWTGGDYAGIGPGAHGRITLEGQRFATEAARNPTAWLDMVEKQASGDVERSGISREDQATEAVIMGLRLRSGIDAARIDTIFEVLAIEDRARRLVEQGFLERDDIGLRLTPQGWPLQDAVQRELLV